MEEQKALALDADSTSRSAAQSSSSTNDTASNAPSEAGTQPSGKRKKERKYRLKKLLTGELVARIQRLLDLGPDDFEEVKQKKKRAPDEPKQQDLAAFWMFWRLYPKKDIVGAAIAAWKKMQPDSDTVEKIVRDVQKRCKSFDWMKDNGRWIPFAHIYLRDQRWLDEGIDQSVIQRRTVL